MPFDAMLLSAAVISMFVVFAGVLMWGDIQTRPERLRPSHLRQPRGNKIASENFIALRP
jgi:hypothetical protein